MDGLVSAIDVGDVVPVLARVCFPMGPQIMTRTIKSTDNKVKLLDMKQVYLNKYSVYTMCVTIGRFDKVDDSD